MDKKKKNLVIACCFLFAGFVIFPLGSFTFIKSGFKAQKLDLPGTALVTCYEAGKYILWYDYKAGQTLEATKGSFELKLIRKSDGMSMPIQLSSNAFTRSSDEFDSIAFADFKIEKVGEYELTLNDIKGEGSFSFGKSRSAAVMVALGIGLLGCVLSIVIACVILAATYVPVFQGQKKSN